MGLGQHLADDLSHAQVRAGLESFGQADDGNPRADPASDLLERLVTDTATRNDRWAKSIRSKRAAA